MTDQNAFGVVERPRNLIPYLLCAALFLSAARPTLAQPSQKVVLELFTSQGCSSCPPADALLGDYAARDDVIALSLPVDYWDRLGWKDSFASPVFSERQRRYAAERGDGEVYTPQIIIGGRVGAVGSSRDEIEAGIARIAETAGHCPVRLELKPGPRQVRISVANAAGQPVSGCPISATVYLARVQREGSVKIRRGENGGREITYHNIVRSLDAVGVWQGTPFYREIDVGEPQAGSNSFYVVLLQQGITGPILNSAVFDQME